MRAVPLPYQIESVDEIDRFGGRCLLAHDMGLGKTLISLWWWQRTPRARPGLVVCPAGVKHVWEREARDNLGVRPLVIEGTRARRIEGDPGLVIVNYDVLRSWEEELTRHGFRSLFADEVHYAKNPKAKRTKALRAIAKGIPNVVAISGTPLLSRPIELFPTLQMIRPKTFCSRWSFAHAFCKPRWTPWGWRYDGADNLPELHDMLRQACMIRRTKAEVLPELPAKIRRVLPLSLTKWLPKEKRWSEEAARSEYDLARDDFLTWIGRTDPARLFSARRAEALVRLGHLKRLASRLKLRAVVRWANEWLASYPGEKLILFAHHRRMIDALRRRVQAESVVVDGSVTGKRRTIAIDRFQRDDRIRLLVGNVRAGGVGITLTAASTVAFAELDWVPANMTQAEDRSHRIGQTRRVWVWWLVAAGTIEEDLCSILERKDRVVRSVLDGEESEDDLDVHRQLLSRMVDNR